MNQRGRLIAIEGLDGTGKATQVQMLKDYLISQGMTFGKDFTIVSFPRYNCESAYMVESYLYGRFGKDPADVDPYTASMFYMIDRSISYKTEEWGRVYDNGGLVIADRYSFSNIFHQGSKVKNIPLCNTDALSHSREFIDFVDWCYKTEFVNMAIPRPDVAIFLKLSDEANSKMLEKRKQEEGSGDIHENNHEYLNNCRIVMEAFEKLMGNTAIKCKMDNSVVKISHLFLNADIDGVPYCREKMHEFIIDTLKHFRNII